MKPEDIPNWDKLPDEASRNFVRTASERTSVTINDDGLFMIDLMSYPSTPGAFLFKEKENTP